MSLRIIKKDGELYAYDTNGDWNGEEWTGWHCDELGILLDNDKANYSIKPIYKGVGEPDEDGDYEEFEIVDYEVRKI